MVKEDDLKSWGWDLDGSSAPSTLLWRGLSNLFWMSKSLSLLHLYLLQRNMLLRVLVNIMLGEIKFLFGAGTTQGLLAAIISVLILSSSIIIVFPQAFPLWAYRFLKGPDKIVSLTTTKRPSARFRNSFFRWMKPRYHPKFRFWTVASSTL